MMRQANKTRRKQTNPNLRTKQSTEWTAVSCTYSTSELDSDIKKKKTYRMEKIVSSCAKSISAPKGIDGDTSRSLFSIQSIPVESIVIDTKNQYRDTIRQDVENVKVSIIRKHGLRQHLLTILVKEHTMNCICDKCNEYDRGYDLYGGFHRIQALFELMKDEVHQTYLSEQLMDKTRNEICIPAEVMVC